MSDQYFETECDFSDFDPIVPESMIYDDEERVYPFDYQSDYYEGE